MANDVLTTLPPVVGAAFVVSIAMYPVDVVRAICMSNPGTSAGSALKGFVAHHGLGGFLKQGLVAEIAKASFSRSIKFWCQPLAHQAIFGVDEKSGTPLTKGIAGAAATIPEVFVISPLENIKLAQQLDREGRFKGFSSTAGHLVRSNGPIGGLYIGYAGMQVRQMLWTGGYFMSLDVFKSGVSQVVSDPLLRDILSGFGAGVFGTMLNCWTDVVRSIMQKETIANTFVPGAPKPSTLSHFSPVPLVKQTVTLFKSRGIAGLYAGLPAKCVHLGGSGALLAVLMPRFKAMWAEKMAANETPKKQPVA